MHLDLIEAAGRAWSTLLEGVPSGSVRPAVGTTPADVVLQRGNARLWHYRSRVRPRGSTPVLLVPSIINRSYILDLTEGFSLVAYLVERGLDVYLLDWGQPNDEDRFVPFDDLVQPMLQRNIDAVLDHAGAERLTLVGYCMGGTLAVMGAALYPDRVAALVNLLGPIDFTKAGMLSDWTRASSFDPELLVDAYGNMPATLMQAGFQLLRPLAQLGKIARSVQGNSTPDLERFGAALDAWASDNIAFPGAAYTKYIRALYQQNALFEGVLEIHGIRVDARCIQCPLLNVWANADAIVPPPSARALASIVGTEHVDEIEARGGHVAAVVGPRGRAELWPALAEWLLGISGGPS